MTMPDTKVLVLVAEDDEGIRETTAMILRQAGYTVVEAEDGEDAVEKMAADRFDVAVLDVRMPRRDGIWVVENIDPAPPPPVIVLASAYVFDQEMRSRLGSKVFRYFRKPVPPIELLAAIDQSAELARQSHR